MPEAVPAAAAPQPVPLPTPEPIVAKPAAVPPSTLPPEPAAKTGGSSAVAILAVIVISVGVLGGFAWWLTSRSSAPADQEISQTEPVSAEASPEPGVEVPAVLPQVMKPAPVDVPVVVKPVEAEVIETESDTVTPSYPETPVDVETNSQRLKTEEAARNEQARQRERERDKARLNKANKTLDDLLN